MKKNAIRVFFPILVLMLLVGCGPATRLEQGSDLSSNVQGRQPPVNEAEWAEAARSWQQQAERMRLRGEDPTPLLLKAARAWAMAGQNQNAESLLAQLPDQLNQTQRIAADLVRARVALNRQSASEALAWLTLRDEQIPPELKTDFYRMQGDALAQLQVWLDAALAYQKAASWLADDRQARPLNQKIFQSLSRVDSAQLQQALNDDHGSYRRYPEFLGWLAFTLAVRNSLNQPEQLQQNLAQWRQYFPLHPAGAEFLQQSAVSLPVELQPPRQIGLLLPLQGPYRAPSRAVEQGILARLFEEHSDLDLRIYPLDEGTSQVADQYLKAVNEGADWVVGPLLKPQVAALQNLNLSVPVLALNETDTLGVPNPALFHFALSPEDEAGQMAQLMWQRGMQRSLILVPDNARGLRIEQAFRDRYQPLGGMVVAVGRYNPVKPDHSSLLRRLLQIDASEQRHQALQRLLQEKLEFEPRSRDDADAIFLFANAIQARQIRPQLKFYRGGHFPVFATSAVYEGSPNPQKDRDLNGVMFCDMPWLYGMGDSRPRRETLAELLPEAAGILGRFHAMGLDILPLLSYLPWMREHPEFTLPAATGQLRLQGQLIHRGLTCFRFRKGQPEWFASVALPAEDSSEDAQLLPEEHIPSSP